MLNDKREKIKSVLYTMFLFFLLCSRPLRSGCLELDFIFETGIRAGATNEFVYEGDKKISQIDWNDRFVPTVGFKGQIEGHNFLLKLGITSAIPVMSGEMEDYDYLLPNNVEPSHYSWHDIYLDKDFSCSIEGGY